MRDYKKFSYIILSYVIANDLSATAAEAMRQNVAINGLGPEDLPESTPTEGSSSVQKARQKLGKVRVNEGDAWCVFMITVDRGAC